MSGLIQEALAIIKHGANSAMSEEEFLEAEIASWKDSKLRKSQITGELYYDGQHDILNRKREVIVEGGVLEEVGNLPNNRIVYNKYEEAVDKKVNYLVGNPITIKTDNKSYSAELKKIFDYEFDDILKKISRASLNGGVAHLYPYYEEDEENKLCFKLFPSYEVLPFWKDKEHTKLESFVRLYQIQGYEGRKPVIIEKVEYYTANGVKYYVIEKGKLKPDDTRENSDYIKVLDNGEVKSYNWGRLPLVTFKYKDKEIPLINRVKSIQDGINLIVSNFLNGMEEDPRNSILIVVNYDGTELGEFRKNLATYGAVKVKEGGDVRTLEVKVNHENYESILKILKDALIECAKAYDSKDERVQGTPNQMNIQSMYSDIRLDANDMELSYKSSLKRLLWFVNTHLANTGGGNYEGEDVDIIFNRDEIINRSQLIEDILKLTGTYSKRTIMSLLPFDIDADSELKQLKTEEREENEDLYPQGNPLKTNAKDNDGE